jgi:hypothetical protein
MRKTNVADFHLLSKQRWNDEVIRIVKASKASQRRMVEWSPQLERYRPVA